MNKITKYARNLAVVRAHHERHSQSNQATFLNG